MKGCLIFFCLIDEIIMLKKKKDKNEGASNVQQTQKNFKTILLLDMIISVINLHIRDERNRYL